MITTQPPQITDWNRVTVSQKPDSSAVPESFEPIDYATKAYTLMKHSLETYNPHTILIERQRYRSGGGSAVQEWTVRVNMLESMFHAVLYTLLQSKEYDIKVYSVSPRRVTQLWTAGIEEKMNIRETKLAKIKVAEKIVAGEEVKVKFLGQAMEVAEGFNEKGGKIKKFDDLADAMLQGLGWWQWHINRSVMMDEILSWEDVVKSEKKRVKTDRTPAKRDTRRVKNAIAETPFEMEDNNSDNNSETAKKLLTRKKKLLEII